MSFKRFLNRTLTVKRAEWSGNSSSQVSVGTVKAHIQQSDINTTEHYASRFSITHKCWVEPDADIQESDSVESDKGNTYNVQTVEDVSYFGSHKHKLLLLEKTNL